MKIFCRDEGLGAPVVLVHGLGASSRTFDALIRLGGYRFLAIDLPNVGGSQSWASGAEPRHIATALGDHLTTLGLTRYRLFGHSFGGLVAICLAAERPSAIEGLVIANAPALGLTADAKKTLKQPALDVMSQWLQGVRLPVPRAVVKAYLQWLWGEPGAVTEAAIDASVENAKNPGFLRSMLESMRSIAEFQLPHEALRSAHFSKHVLWGDRDRLVSVIEGERLALAIGADFKVLTGVGHCLPEEAPKAVLEALAEVA